MESIEERKNRNEKSNRSLMVVSSGPATYLGWGPNKKEFSKVEEISYDNPSTLEETPVWGSKILLYDAFVVGEASVVDPQTRTPLPIAILGCPHWISYEPIRMLLISYNSLYFVDDQSEENSKKFHEIYHTYLENLAKIKAAAESGIQIASGDIVNLINSQIPGATDLQRKLGRR